MRIYVASSWRNEHQPRVVEALREAGHKVYDFRHPSPGDNGFHWSEIDPDWQRWGPSRFREALSHPLATQGFAKDFEAMSWADAFVLVQPCGRSAHLELGWAVGAGKLALILLDGGEPELMYGMATVCTSVAEVVEQLKEYDGSLRLENSAIRDIVNAAKDRVLPFSPARQERVLTRAAQELGLSKYRRRP